jgi:hypothetical protein
MANFLRKFKNNQIIMLLPKSFFILQIAPSKEADFVKWSQALKKYGVDAKFIKPSNVLGIFANIYNRNVPNIFQVSSVLVYVPEDTNLCLFTQYALFLEKEATLTLIKSQKVKILVGINEGKFYHAETLKTIKNPQKQVTVKNLIVTSYKPLLTTINICNLPLYKLVWLFSGALQQQK